MSLPKYKDLNSLTTVVDIEKEIFILQKRVAAVKTSLNYFEIR